MYQLIKHILKDPRDKTKIKLYYCSRDAQNILLKNELDILRAKYPDQLELAYCVDDGKGFPKPFNISGLKQALPDPSLGKDACVLVCGPDG